MPKIVDHEAYRNEIADRAVEVFRRRGYAGIGMREMARELGMSKSALYHYFPSKDALFLACSARVARISPDTEQRPVPALVTMARSWEDIFPGEVRIMLDYIGDRAPDDLQHDEALAVAMEGFSTGLSQVVPVHLIPRVLSAVFGFLLLRYFDGRQTPWDELEKLLESIV
ncbi:MAG: TetR/AcrR family transcriptional regulator [Alkalispirochaeta sp.]